MGNNIILGAGISGLGAWYADNSAEIYEMDDKPGGLCGQININGFHFDRAVHLSFTKSELVKSVFSNTEYFTHHPIPKSWYHELWIKHPAQNNLFPLPAEEKIKAVTSFIKRDQTLKDDNFKDWNRNRYGEYLWQNFFEPYNSKYWDIDLGMLSSDWIGNRIYQPLVEELLYGTYTDETPNTYYAPEMKYPKHGGYFEFIKFIADQAESMGKMNYSFKAVKVDIENHVVQFSNGESREYDRLYTSVPMPLMIQMSRNIPSQFENINIFDATGVVVISMGLKRANLHQMWFYIYDEDIMAARANMPSEKSPSNAPDGMTSIQFEIYFNRKKDIPDREMAIDNCMTALTRIGIADSSDVIFADYRILPFGNVILKNGDRVYASNVMKWFNQQDVYPIGRFGRWEYLWSDQSFLSGYNAVD